MEELGFQETNTVRDYIHILFKHKWVSVTSFLVIMSTGYIGLAMKTPMYTSQVKMLISAEKQVESPYYRELNDRSGSHVAVTQSEIVKSKPVIERVVRALKLYNRPDNYASQFSSPIKKEWAKWQKQLDTSKPTQKKNKKKKVLPFYRAFNELAGNIEVEPISDTNLLLISVKDYSPENAAEIANVVSRSYVIFDLEQQLAELTLKYGQRHPKVEQLKDAISLMNERIRSSKTDIIEFMGPASVKIIEQATVPLSPSGPPKRLTLLLVLFLSIFVGLALSFVFERLDQTFRSSQEVERDLELPLLGSIPRRSFFDNGLIKNVGNKSRYAESYRTLSDQIYIMMKDQEMKTLLVTSAMPKEGTTTIISNIAMHLTENLGREVLIIDANINNPSIHEIMDVRGQSGLAQILEGEKSFEEQIVKVNSQLFMLPAGCTSKNPIKLLNTLAVEDVLRKSRIMFEVVLIDCASFGKTKEAAVLSKLVEGVIIMVNEGKTRRQTVRRALKFLLDRKPNVLGVIFNNRSFPIPKFIYDSI